MSLIDKKISLLKDTEGVLQRIASLVEMSVIKNGNVLAIHERSFIIKNVVSFYAVCCCVIFNSIPIFIKRTAKKIRKLLSKSILVDIEKLILSSGKTHEDRIDGKFFLKL